MAFCRMPGSASSARPGVSRPSGNSIWSRCSPDTKAGDWDGCCLFWRPSVSAGTWWFLTRGNSAARFCPTRGTFRPWGGQRGGRSTRHRRTFSLRHFSCRLPGGVCGARFDWKNGPAACLDFLSCGANATHCTRLEPGQWLLKKPRSEIFGSDFLLSLSGERTNPQDREYDSELVRGRRQYAVYVDVDSGGDRTAAARGGGAAQISGSARFTVGAFVSKTIDKGSNISAWAGS
jgi:hypothetical protein